MYLIHNTDITSLKSILKDKCLKSLSLQKKTNKKAQPNEGSNLYTENNYVYFSCTNKLFDNKVFANIAKGITLYFNSNLLFNKSFYVANLHSYTPQQLATWGFNYKKKYNKNYTKYNSVLTKLYNYSISVLKKGEAFQVFQQIAVRNKVNLDELVAIQFYNKSFATESIIKYITKFYPNIIIKINN
jgi:hypothetical protein